MPDAERLHDAAARDAPRAGRSPRIANTAMSDSGAMPSPDRRRPIPVRPRARKRVEDRRVGGLERRAAVELRDRVVAEAVEADVAAARFTLAITRYFTIRANSSGSRLAPPTSAPSISGCAMKSRMFPAFTLPPYWIRTACATLAVVQLRRASAGSAPITWPASAGSALRPVPIAQIGSYATTSVAGVGRRHARERRLGPARSPRPRSRRRRAPRASRRRTGSASSRARRPPAPSWFTVSSVSPNSCRRSECPTIT